MYYFNQGLGIMKNTSESYHVLRCRTKSGRLWSGVSVYLSCLVSFLHQSQKINNRAFGILKCKQWNWFRNHMIKNRTLDTPKQLAWRTIYRNHFRKHSKSIFHTQRNATVQEKYNYLKLDKDWGQRGEG